jgi:hypothetical protein
MSAITNSTWPSEFEELVEISIREHYFPNELLRGSDLPAEVFKKICNDVERLCVEKMGFLVAHFSFTTAAPEADEKLIAIQRMADNIRDDVVKVIMMQLFQYVLGNPDTTWKQFYEKVGIFLKNVFSYRYFSFFIENFFSDS